MYGLILVTFLTASCVVGDLPGIIHPLVLGGKLINIEDAPFMAQYVTITLPNKGSRCGASIISEEFVLSAAHCYKGPENKQVVVVGTDILATEPHHGGQTFHVEYTTVHPCYDEETADYDVLLLKLRGKLTFSAKIKPIKMADSRLLIRDGTILETMGFGVTEYGSASKHLRKIRIPYIDQKRCSSLGYDLTDRIMCAGKIKSSVCSGDSGGPLIYGNILVGIVSFSTCGTDGEPSGFTRVSSVRDFIDDVIDRT